MVDGTDEHKLVSNLVFLFKGHGAEAFNMLQSEVMEQRGYIKC